VLLAGLGGGGTCVSEVRTDAGTSGDGGDRDTDGAPTGLGGNRASEVRADAGTSGDGGDRGTECGPTGDIIWSDTVPYEL
jgi:hypothetical protein